MTRLNQFSIYDELPLWSAPFGLTLLDTIRLKKDIRVLDIGSGAGFPMLEVAERAGKSCFVYGIDPSEDSIRMITEKIGVKGIANAQVVKGVAEELPFPDKFFGMVTSNNGLNNVRDEKKALGECYRVLSENSQMVLTMNLPHTLHEFYDVFEQVLLSRGMKAEAGKLKVHIHAKRKPADYWKESILRAGFTIRSINVDGFNMKFTDGTAFLEHYFIRTAFRKPWEEITPDPGIYKAVEETLNRAASSGEGITMSVPYACYDCVKP
jgi:arsenite methyltransferase